MVGVAEQHENHWSAWFESKPTVAFGGDTAAKAATRLLEAHGIDPSQVQASGNPTISRLELRISTAPCPDCGGSGKYIGLNSVETCKGCGGSRVMNW